MALKSVEGKKISFSLPLPESARPGSSIGFGFDSANATLRRDFRIQSVSNNNEHSPLIIASSPVQVTTIQYSSDMRIKKDIQSVDEREILQRIKKINVRSYRYSDDWLKVRDDIPDTRVRGVIAQELAEVFPEYVTTIPEYTLKDKNFTIKDFHQVDKTSIIMDTIGALQALEKRFSVSANGADRTGSISINSESVSDAFDTNDDMLSGSIRIMSGASSVKSGDIVIGLVNPTKLMVN